MSKIDDGWPLFRWDTEPATESGVATGMTLRDYFAAKAMNGILSCDHPITRVNGWASAVATAAYEMADAMLKAREEKP